MKTLTILGRRWFQKTYGNTYHTADIFVNGKLIHTLPVAYGYGEMYLQRAAEWLRQTGYLYPQHAETDPTGPIHLTSWAKNNGVTLAYSAADVARRRDLNAPDR